MKAIFITDCEVDIYTSPESDESETVLIEMGEVREFTIIGQPQRMIDGKLADDPANVNVQFSDGTVATGIARAWFREATDLKRGARVYDVCNGKLEVGTFLEEGIVEGASLPTWLVRHDGRKIRCSPKHYLPSAEAAWERYLQQCKDAIPGLQEHIEEAKHNLAFTESEVKRVEGLLRGEPRRLAEAYYALYPGELPSNPDWSDLANPFADWLDRLHKDSAKALATTNWAGKATAAYFSMLGKPLPKTKRKMLEEIPQAT